MGTIYRINNKYEIVKGFRRFQKIPCYLVDKGAGSYEQSF